MLAHAKRAGVGVPCPKMLALEGSRLNHGSEALGSTTGATAATCSGKAHATAEWEERPTVNFAN
jgi:hypothetical protein